MAQRQNINGLRTRGRQQHFARVSRADAARLFAEAKPKHDCVLLNVAAADAGVPLVTIAKVAGVSKYSVYLWVAGLVEPRAKHASIIRRLTRALRAAIEAGDLPPLGRATDIEATVRRHL